MGRPLRIFVSSTMEDLANERDQVCQCIKELNAVPVNAESWSPNGQKSWDRIVTEIRSSDIFVLLLGTRYGWCPPPGSETDGKKSVTHMEFDEARRLGLPILPFLKRLAYNSERTSPDAIGRDAFRKEILDWATGLFRGAEFDLARDLAPQVASAIMEVLVEDYVARDKITRRSADATNVAASLASGPPSLVPSISIPSALREAVAGGRAVLFAGSGISATAGIPSSQAFVETLANIIRKTEPDYYVNPTGVGFSGVATDVESLVGRAKLIEAVTAVVKPPQSPGPTQAHQAAVRLFPRIITTNFDEFFEDAAKLANISLNILGKDFSGTTLPEKAFVKLHGSTLHPDSLILTESDTVHYRETHADLIRAITATLQDNILITIGTALRDPSIISLLDAVGPKLRGFYVVNRSWSLTKSRLARWNLTPLDADADAFMAMLAAELAVGRPTAPIRDILPANP